MSDVGTVRSSSLGSARGVDGNVATHRSILKSSSKYGLGPTETRDCDMQNSSSVVTVARSGRWPLYRTSTQSTDTRGRTVDCIRGSDEKCRDESKLPSQCERVSRRRSSVVADLLVPDASLYGTGGHTKLVDPTEYKRRRLLGGCITYTTNEVA